MAHDNVRGERAYTPFSPADPDDQHVFSEFCRRFAGLTFRGDAGDFLEMAGNLLDNACKWCKGSVRISVTGTPGGETRMVVADDGPGIPDDAADSLLQRGTRLDENTPGHGIGLAVVKELAESYGGALEIGRSDLGGAQFTITIP